MILEILIYIQDILTQKCQLFEVCYLTKHPEFGFICMLLLAASKTSTKNSLTDMHEIQFG